MQRTISGSFRLRLMALVMLGILPPLLGGTWYATYRASKIFRADAQQSMTIKAAALGEHIDQWHEQNLQVLDDLRAGTDFSTMERDQQLPTMLSTLQARKADVDLVATVDLDGEIVADVSARPRMHKNYRHQDWFQEAISGDNNPAQATVIPRQGEPTVLFSKAILSQPTLRVGDRNNTVAQLQTRLQNLGYYSGPVDGIYEGATVEAIERFKRAFNQKSAAGEPVGSQVDAITWQTIELAEQAKTKDIAPITAEFTRTASRLDILQSDTAEVEGVVMMEAQLDSIAEVVGKVNVGPGGVALVMDETGQVIAHSSKLPKALKEPAPNPTENQPTDALDGGIATESSGSARRQIARQTNRRTDGPKVRTIEASRQARARGARLAKLGKKQPISTHFQPLQTTAPSQNPVAQASTTAQASATAQATNSQSTATAAPGRHRTSQQNSPNQHSRPNHTNRPRPNHHIATASALPLGQENLAKASQSLSQHISRLNTPSPASPIALASKQPVTLAALPNLSNFPPVAALIRGKSGPLTFEDQGQRWMAHGEKLANGWSVLLLVPNEDFSKDARGFRHLSINTAAIALLITAAATGLLSAKLSRPINLLSTAATALSQGELNQKIDIKSKDEIGTIATAFNSVADQLQVSFSQLADQNESLKRLDQLKDQFLANTSHELKTPLNGMIGIAESLLDGAAGNLTDLQRQNIAMIASSSHRLTRLVNDILDFSKLQHQQLSLHRKTLGIRASVDVVLALSRSLMNNPSLKLVNEIPADLPLVYADENRLQQILLNLVSNAIKFTERGTVTVSATLVDDASASPQPTHLEISIHDTGIGIAPERLENIFEPFQQVENSARSYGGTGLGLSITRNLLSLHDGKIWVASVLGEGSTFSFTLPLATAPLATEKPAETRPDKDIAEKGGETKENFSEKTSPSRKGELLAQVVRPIAKNLPQMRSLRQRAKLSQTLEKVFHPKTIGPKATGADKTVDLKAKQAAAQISANKFNILVVDDEPINVQVLKNHLSLENYTVTQALNGEEALALIHESQRHDQQFDLVVLDVMMPRMSGYEVCAKLRESHPAHELPVVMLTAKNQVSDLITGFQFGANDYMTKPFSKDELLTRIQSHLRLSKTSHSYGRFVPSEYLRFLEKESIVDVRLGDHVSKEMAVMFSDIRSFTTLSESMTPQENFDFVNAYLRQVSPVIRDHDGFIVKYLGDGMMAVFPKGADDAIASGIAKLRSVADYNLRRQAQGFAPIRVGIGVHFGHMMVGMVGESARMQGDAFSDNVNLTARLESLTKLYGVSMVISDRALELLTDPEQYNIRFLDRVIVKGRSEPIDLYHILDGESAETISQTEQSQPLFTQGITHYQAGDFLAAKACFSAILQQPAENKAAQLYCDRLTHLIETPPQNWTGVWKLAQK